VIAGLLVASAVAGVVALTAAGNGTLQTALDLAGFGQSAGDGSEPHHTATAASLDTVVTSIASEVGDLSRQNQIRGSQQDDLRTRIAELDRELGTLRDKVAREGLFQQDTVLRGALTDLSALQTSFEQSQITQKKAVTDLQQGLTAQQTSLAEITRRLAQIETTVASRDVTSSIRPQPAKRRIKVVRSRPAAVNAAPPVLGPAPHSIVTTLD
jgi:hypothetical protein